MDGGYHSGANVEACERQGWMVVMPEAQQRALEWPYHKDRFTYDEGTDSYICPQGQALRFRRAKRTRGTLVREYRALGAVCRRCSAFGTCTKNDVWGRRLEIRPHEPALRRHRAWMETDEAKAAYGKRKQLVKPAFGILKEQMGLRRFLLRGLDNVRAEWTMLATAFNLRTLWRFSSKLKAGIPPWVTALTPAPPIQERPGLGPAFPTSPRRPSHPDWLLTTRALAHA